MALQVGIERQGKVGWNSGTDLRAIWEWAIEIREKTRIRLWKGWVEFCGWWARVIVASC